MTEIKSLVLAIVLSTLIIVGWNTFFMQRDIAKPQKIIVQRKEPVLISLTQALHKSERVYIKTNKLHGSISLRGAYIDDLSLVKYKENIGKRAKDIRLFSPNNTAKAYFAEFGWHGGGAPDADTVWHADKREIGANDTVTLSWRNGRGITFMLKISVDNDYMFTVEQIIHNESGSTLQVRPYGTIERLHDLKRDTSYLIMHTGLFGMINGDLLEIKYKELRKKNSITAHVDGDTQSKFNWFGFTDKYWASVLVPMQRDELSIALNTVSQQENRFAVSFTEKALEVLPHSSLKTLNRLFVGAKELSSLDYYNNKYDIASFDKIVDFGHLYFITKPVFLMLEYFHSLVGNFGLAILLLTLVVRIILFPLAHKSYVSMFHMKKIQPEIRKLQDMYKDDKMKLRQETMTLFKKHHVRPMAGCLPALMQAPIFFALYKVLFITIEMRHAHFFAWIKDLSMPDPTNVLNLFGLLPWKHTFISIGILPIILGLTMVIQQKLGSSITAQDSTQEFLIKAMPYLFIFMFANFPAGLILYWTFSNILSIIHQAVIKYFIVK